MGVVDEAIEDGVGVGWSPITSCHLSIGIWLVRMVESPRSAPAVLVLSLAGCSVWFSEFGLAILSSTHSDTLELDICMPAGSTIGKIDHDDYHILKIRLQGGLYLVFLVFP
jgi:hypothetical protein